MGPYCIYCGTRCFVPIPLKTPQKILDAYKGLDLMATCAGGQAFEKEKLGYSYYDIPKEIREQPIG